MVEELTISMGHAPINFNWKTEHASHLSKIHVCLLSDDQKDNHINISQELLDLASDNQDLIKNIYMGDKTLVYGCDIEMKAQSSLWEDCETTIFIVGKESPHPKKSQRLCQSSTKVMFLTRKGWFIVNLFHADRQNTRNIIVKF